MYNVQPPCTAPATHLCIIILFSLGIVTPLPPPLQAFNRALYITDTVKSQEKWHRIINDLKFPHVFLMSEIHTRPLLVVPPPPPPPSLTPEKLKLSTSVWQEGTTRTENLTATPPPPYLAKTNDFTRII